MKYERFYSNIGLMNLFLSTLTEKRKKRNNPKLIENIISKAVINYLLHKCFSSKISKTPL